MQASDPRFVSLAAQPGLASVDPGEVTPVLMVDLGIGGSALGRLTLYPAQSEGFAAIDTAVAGVLAVHAALAIAAMRQTAHLSAAMDSRSIVGQAQGIVMERNHVDADAAFALLRRYSQNNNLRLREVAQSLITTRQLAR